MSLPLVAFDESGNTGQNLLDQDQPVFTLAAVRLEGAGIELLRDVADWDEDEELHFTDLKGSGRGRERILNVLESEIATPEHVKIFVLHKRYMVVAKIVDMLVEELAYRMDFNLADQGGHIALANLLHMCLPTFCGVDRYEELLDSFVEMVREPNSRTVAWFYRVIRSMKRSCSHPPFQMELDILHGTQVVVRDVLAQVNRTDLDPAIPAFVALGAAWDVEIDEPWKLIHDESKPIRYDKEILECFAGATAPRRTFHFARSSAKFPLRVEGGIQLKDSKSHPEIQVADLFAGAANVHASGYLSPEAQDAFWWDLPKECLLRLTAGAVWPDTEVDPAKLGLQGREGYPARETGELIGAQMREKHGEDWFQKYKRGELAH